MDLEQFEAISLTPEQRQHMSAAAIKGLLNLVVAQAVALLVVTLVSLIISGQWGAMSAIAGGMTYLIPTSMFVLHLVLRLHSQKTPQLAPFL